MDCTTKDCDYTRRGTSRLRKGGDLAAIADDIESGIETCDIVSPDLPLFSTSKKKRIFVYSFSELSTALLINTINFIKKSEVIESNK